MQAAAESSLGSESHASAAATQHCYCAAKPPCRQSVYKWAWLCTNNTLFRKIGSGGFGPPEGTSFISLVWDGHCDPACDNREGKNLFLPSNGRDKRLLQCSMSKAINKRSKRRKQSLSPLSNEEDLANGGMPSLSSKNHGSSCTCLSIGYMLNCFSYVLVVSPWNTQSLAWPRSANFRELMGTFEQTPPTIAWAIFHPYLISLWKQPVFLKSFCVVFIWCVYMLYKTLKIKSQGVVSRYKFHPSYGVTVASIQCHNECLLCAKEAFLGSCPRQLLSLFSVPPTGAVG